MKNVLVILKDKIKEDFLTDYLTKCNYKVINSKDIKIFNKIIQQRILDAAIVEKDVLNFNGRQIGSILKTEFNIPIVFVGNDDVDRIMAEELNIEKYYHNEVDVYKIQNVLNNIILDKKKYFIDDDEFILDKQEGTLCRKNDNSSVYLTPNEISIIECLYNNIDKIAKKEDILNILYDENCLVDNNTLAVNINRIRSKLKKVGINIINKRGIGYYIEID